jgi:pyruvate/2-oxoglutarate dehydrogenase complex dihydrolipoamide dehydrogenase (E3) component
VQKRGREKIVFFVEKGRRRSVVGDEIFYALGRQPRIQGLNLEAAGVKVEAGRIQVNRAMRTTAQHIFAAGDVTGLYEVVHMAIQQGEVAARNAVVKVQNRGQEMKMDYRLKTLVTFTDPEIAVVGLTEKEAVDRKLPVLVASYPFNDHGKSMIMGAKHGFVKLIAERKRGEIVGGQVVGPHASDLIHEIIAVMNYRGTVEQLAAMPHYHPTLSEIWTYPAEEIRDQLILLSK